MTALKPRRGRVEGKSPARVGFPRPTDAGWWTAFAALAALIPAAHHLM